MVILYLFQDKWDYLSRQGVPPGIVGNDPNNVLTSSSQQVEDQIGELLNEAPYRKSNALGSHFSRTNVLNKLFQLT